MNTDRLPRITSIDILRSLTMLLMIFVNDLWNVIDFPEWLEHTKKYTDGMGLADTVFPAFLVIVGMSIPFAVESRKRRGDGDLLIFRHVVQRSLALIVMGVFLVNGESIDAQATGLSGNAYNTLACLSFIFIWNDFPAAVNRIWVMTLQVMGWLILLILAWIYRGGEHEVHRFATSWWGILGLIGWAYLLCAAVFVVGKGRFWVMIGLWLACLCVSTAFHAHWIAKRDFISMITSPLGHGAMPALAALGSITSLLFIRWSARNRPAQLVAGFLLMAGALVGAGFALRHFFIISKILASPSWVLICSGITVAMFVLIYWLADIRHQTSWAKLIRPAGNNTLLCYLLPYFAYALFAVLHLSLPEFLLNGVVGLVKTFVFALVIVMAAGWLMRINIRLKL